MADDPWGSWNPTSNPSVRGMEAYQARRALSRGLSVDPQAAAPPARPPPSSTSNFKPVAGPSSVPARRPLPEQSFPGGGRGGPSRSGAGAGWQRSPPRSGHIDHGWASKTGHEEPIAKPVMVGDIESASNAPLTKAQLQDMQNSSRSGRNDMQDRMKRRLDDEKKHLDSSKYSPRESRRARSRDRDSIRDKDRDLDRERDRKRPRTDEDRERRRPRERSRSRSRSRERDRRDDRRERRREDERRDKRRNDNDTVRERRRSRSPRRDRHGGDDHRQRDRGVDSDDKRTRPPAKAEGESKKSQLYADDTKEATQQTSESRNSDVHSNEYAVVISGVREGTTAGDMTTILEDYGQLTYCKRMIDADSPEGTVAFEAGFQDSASAEKAVRDLDGMLADGCKLKTRLLPRVKQEEEEDVNMHADSPELKLKGFAASNNKDNSLLSRLAVPIKGASADVNGKDKSNGSATKLPSSSTLLAPYEDLLSRAGVDSLDTLRKFVRPGSVKEYIEMLCKEYPNEDVLQGLTARWALKERLEEWLGEKEPLTMDWRHRSVAA